MNNKNLSVIICPPLKDYPKQPSDMSKCHEVICRHCDQLMWLSEKKEAIIKVQRANNHEILIACYPCIEKMVGEDPFFFSNNKKVDI